MSRPKNQITLLKNMAIEIKEKYEIDDIITDKDDIAYLLYFLKTYHEEWERKSKDQFSHFKILPNDLYRFKNRDKQKCLFIVRKDGSGAFISLINLKKFVGKEIKIYENL